MNMKLLILLLLCLTIVTKVLCLDCEVTDFEALTKNTTRSKVQNCNEYFGNYFELEDIFLSCYQVNIISDDDSRALLKGCIPEGGCSMLKLNYQKILADNPIVRVKKITCDECRSNGCNVEHSSYNNSANIKWHVGVTSASLFALAVVVQTYFFCM